MFGKRDDHELLRLIGEGEERAFSELFARYSRLVLGYCRRLLGRQEAAEDVAQEVWMKVVRQAAAYKAQEKNAAAWLLTIARHTSIDLLRKRDELNSSLEDESEGADWPDESRESVESELMGLQEMSRLKAAIDELPAAQRASLMMWMSEEMSYEDIARELNTSVSAVKSLIFRARELVKKRLAGLE